MAERKKMPTSVSASAMVSSKKPSSVSNFCGSSTKMAPFHRASDISCAPTSRASGTVTKAKNGLDP
eukprot:1194905-Prorocentrum_minimum.AAC.4